MQILAALFFEGLDLRQVPGGATHIDLTGIQFSVPAPGPPPVTCSPHRSEEHTSELQSQ